MKKENVFPDFITIDGSEGGTGAAPPGCALLVCLFDGLIAVMIF